MYMMSPDKLAAKLVNKYENQSSGSRKTPSTRPPPEAAVRCPRCDSTNTKFCYYNNYSLTQPRHFCKTCKRYWTKGGALRNVPVGGGCRKSKKIPNPLPRLSGDSNVSGPSSSLNFFNCHSQFSTNLTPIASNPCLDHSNLASSIESLSFINQDLHWKLQQQRLGMLFGGENQWVPIEIQTQKPEPILEISKLGFGDSRKDGGTGGSGGLATTEWLFDNSYAPVNPTPINSNWNNGIEGWSTNLNDQYSALP